jgi:hypothetical protein
VHGLARIMLYAVYHQVRAPGHSRRPSLDFTTVSDMATAAAAAAARDGGVSQQHGLPRWRRVARDVGGGSAAFAGPDRRWLRVAMLNEQHSTSFRYVALVLVCNT